MGATGEAHTISTSRTTAVVASLQLFAVLEHYQNRPFVFVEPGGNFGDKLIYLGGYKLAQLVGLKYMALSHEAFMRDPVPRGAVIYIHGSGGFAPMWSKTPISHLRKAVGSFCEAVIVGPSSVWPDREFLQREVIDVLAQAPPQKIVFMVRERVSFDLMRDRCPPAIELLQDHDTALNLERGDLERGITGGVTRGEVRRFRGGYTLYAIRQDAEATGVARPKPLGVCMDPVGSCWSFSHWLQFHRSARAIVANRLHSAIAGIIFGIPTTVLPNSYHKNRAVWEFSLESRGARWTDHLEGDAVSQIISSSSLLRRWLAKPAVRNVLFRALGAGGTLAQG